MKGQDLKNVKEIFEEYTKQRITDEEAEEIYRKLNEKRKIAINDIWYEPDHTMGIILRKSVYDYEEDKTKGPAKE